jgi:metal-responsive CopG/Arc/MetJ family transcriptional regulator
MRVHIELDDSLVQEIDQRAGSRNRSDYIRRAIAAALHESRRWDMIQSAAGTITASGHDWDDDPAGWVRSQRRGDARRVG